MQRPKVTTVEIILHNIFRGIITGVKTLFYRRRLQNPGFKVILVKEVSWHLESSPYAAKNIYQRSRIIAHFFPDGCSGAEFYFL